MSLTQYADHYIYDKGLNLTNIYHNQDVPQVQGVASSSNRLLEFDYDAAGHQLETENVDEITYNSEGQIALTKKTTGEVTVTEYYTYAAPGHRVKKVTQTVTNDVVTGIDVVLYVGGNEYRTSYTGNHLVYDGDVVTGNISTTQDNVETRLTTEHGQVAKMTRDDQDGSTSYSYNLINNIDSNSVEVDAQSNVISHQGFYPYGGVSSTSGNTDNKQLGFSGQELDSTSLNYYGFRYYNSQSGRWTRPDPIGFESGQINLYAMVRGNPVSLRDKWGLTGKKTLWIGGGNPSNSYYYSSLRESLEESTDELKDRAKSMGIKYDKYCSILKKHTDVTSYTHFNLKFEGLYDELYPKSRFNAHTDPTADEKYEKHFEDAALAFDIRNYSYLYKKLFSKKDENLNNDYKFKTIWKEFKNELFESSPRSRGHDSMNIDKEVRPTYRINIEDTIGILSYDSYAKNKLLRKYDEVIFASLDNAIAESSDALYNTSLLLKPKGKLRMYEYRKYDEYGNETEEFENLKSQLSLFGFESIKWKNHDIFPVVGKKYGVIEAYNYEYNQKHYRNGDYYGYYNNFNNLGYTGSRITSAAIRAQMERANPVQSQIQSQIGAYLQGKSAQTRYQIQSQINAYLKAT